MHPARAGLADATRNLDFFGNPIGAKFDGRKARHMSIAHENEHGLVSITWPGGLFYANTVGNSGSASVWGKLGPPSERGAPMGIKISRR